MKKEENKCNNIIKQYKKSLTLILTKEDNKGHNSNWPQIPDHPYITLLTVGAGSGEKMHYLI